MSGTRLWVAPVPNRGSVFGKLVATMLAMAACLLILVTIFFGFVLGPDLNAVVYRIAQEYSRVVAATAPDLKTAKQLADHVGFQMRYEGPRGNWSTASSVPSIDDVRDAAGKPSHALVRPTYYVVPGSSGGAYLFVWNFSRDMRRAHDLMLGLLLLVIVGIVLTTHAVLRRLLRPLRVLNDGVARLSEGELDVMLPNGPRDEFGRLTSAFNTMVGRVRDMIRARDQLLVDVSHELRSPLTRMKVALELLPDEEKRKRLAADVSEMERMVSELLELERLRLRGIHSTRQDVLPIVHDVAAPFQGQRPGLRVVSPAREMPLDLDAEKVRTVLRNLLENAVKYSRPDSRPIELSVHDDGGDVLVQVTDDGVGIPESQMERVFEPFFRADPSRSKRTGGYGLGLSICKRVMEAHGGSIAVARGASGGASFVLRFPKRA